MRASQTSKSLPRPLASRFWPTPREPSLSQLCKVLMYWFCPMLHRLSGSTPLDTDHPFLNSQRLQRFKPSLQQAADSWCWAKTSRQSTATTSMSSLPTTASNSPMRLFKTQHKTSRMWLLGQSQSSQPCCFQISDSWFTRWCSIAPAPWSWRRISPVRFSCEPANPRYQLRLRLQPQPAWPRVRLS